MRIRDSHEPSADMSNGTLDAAARQEAQSSKKDMYMCHSGVKQPCDLKPSTARKFARNIGQWPQDAE